MINIKKLIVKIEDSVEAHRLERTGEYFRFLASENKEIDPYGCADAANIYYTLGKFPDKTSEGSWISVLRSMQDQKDGLFHESTHHAYHTTAHCIAALELFNAGPSFKLKALSALKELKALREFLDKLEWKTSPWGQSHRGAGIFAALVLAGEVNTEWEKCYFEWLWNESDPKTGLFRKGCIEPLQLGKISSIFPHLAGTFHYLFNMEYRHIKLRYPEKLVDTCLDIIKNDPFPLGRAVNFSEVDWVYCLNRSLKQSGKRSGEGKKELFKFASGYIEYLDSLDISGFDDIHSTFGAVCALAELQSIFPGEIITEIPLRLVLDRRPFI